jgi:hypothetical protein
MPILVPKTKIKYKYIIQQNTSITKSNSKNNQYNNKLKTSTGYLKPVKPNTAIVA